MSNIPIRDLTQTGTPDASSQIVFDNGTMRRGTVGSMADAVRPVASQSEAQVGTDNAKVMTPLRVKDSIAAQVGATLQAYSSNLSNWAVKTIPTGGVVGTSDAQTLTNKTLGSGTVGTTAAVDANTTDLATTAWYWGQQGSITPAMDGTASVGTSGKWAHHDHVHPTDTSRAPVSTTVTLTGTQALTNKTLTAPVINSPTGIVKSDVGLGNVDNTSDANKPVSTAQQTALNLKANLASPAFTGVPTAPTAANGTSTTQLATTAFVIANASGGAGSPLSLNVKDYGAVGDGVTNDFTAITNAIAAAVAQGKSLAFPDGVYCHSSTIEWNKANNLRVWGGKNVTFKHTGTGIAHSFKGITTPGSGDGFKRNFWFWGDRATVQGNPAGGTTVGINIDNWHWSYMQVKIRDCATAFQGSNTGAAGAAAAVESVFDIYVSPAGGETFNVACGYGMYLDLFAACTFINPTIEVCGTGNVFACVLTNQSNGNLFLGGTFESNIYGGVLIGSTCERNTFISTHNEVNGYRDWQVDGNSNTFIGIAGAASASGQGCSGSYNYFQGSTLQSMSVAGTGNTFDLCYFLTAFTNGGTNTTIRNARGGISGTGEKGPVAARQAMSFASGFSNTGSPYENCTYWFNPDFTVQMTGVVTTGTISGPTTIATLPSGFRPTSKVVLTCYNLSTEAVCAITVDTAGLVQTRAGVTTGNILSLAGCSFKVS